MEKYNNSNEEEDEYKDTEDKMKKKETEKHPRNPRLINQIYGIKQPAINVTRS